MAERDKPRAHVIEPARVGAKCQDCGGAIEPRELQLSEALVADEGKWARAHQYACTPRQRSELSDDGPRYDDSLNPDLATPPHPTHHVPVMGTQPGYGQSSARSQEHCTSAAPRYPRAVIDPALRELSTESCSACTPTLTTRTVIAQFPHAPNWEEMA